jgi:hypothetical protein
MYVGLNKKETGPKRKTPTQKHHLNKEDNNANSSWEQ